MKPGTFTQMYVQLVFAVKNRDAVLKKDFRERVFEYMSGIITNLKHKSMIVNGTSNHVHILFGLNPSAYNLYEVCCQMYNCFYNT
jgi:putative transposase